MFGDQAFHTWSIILVGAAMFAALFVLLAMMMELVFEGEFRMTAGVMGFGMVAFVGYLGTAMVLKRSHAPPNK